MYLELDTSLLDAAQAACIALPAAGVPTALLRLGGSGWSLVAPLSIVVSIGVIALALLKAGVLAMAAIDAVVIFGDLFDRENALFDAAARRRASRTCRWPSWATPRPTTATSWPGSSEGSWPPRIGPGSLPRSLRSPSCTPSTGCSSLVDSLPGTVPPALVMLAFGRRESGPEQPARDRQP